VSDDEGRRASPEVGWGYAGRRIVSTVGSRALQEHFTGGRRDCCSEQRSKRCKVLLRWQNNGRM
jgi:hypothetical protein